MKEIVDADRITFEQKIGEGGFGAVYKAQWSGAEVAIKILNGEWNNKNEIAKELAKEINIMVELMCPQIIRIYGAIYNPKQGIVMELMPNGSLYNLLRENKDLSWGGKYRIALDVSYGIRYLHQKDILHRDLKSLNVLLDEKYKAKICDFGLAKVKDKSRNQTETAKSVGTTLWMAPELFDMEVKFTQQSDIYALGMVLYELLTHSMPFEDVLQGRGAGGVVPIWVLQGQRPKIDEKPGPEEFKELIKKCWSQKKDERPLADKVIDRLNEIINSMSTHSAGPIAQGMQDLNINSGPRYLGFSERPSSSRLPVASKAEIQQFLHHIGFGEQNEAEAMLKSTPHLATASGDLTDCAERQFKRITGFQYAVLALDYHMWTMIKKYLTKEDTHVQLEELTRIATLNEQKGWIITPESNTHWPLISWLPLINAIETYAKNCIEWNTTQCRNYWCQQVGGAQLNLPAHVINEYCHPSRSFHPCPKWGNEEVALPRTGVTGWCTNSYSDRLGSEWAWARGGGRRIRQAIDPVGQWGSVGVSDLAALNELLKSRSEQARLLLESELTFRPSSSSRPKF